MTIDWMKLVKDKNPALYQEANLEVFVGPWEAGQDRISRGAPCVVVAYAKKDERTAPPAAMIAIHQIQLAAPALGLGTTFTGSINTASQAYPPLIETARAAGGTHRHSGRSSSAIPPNGICAFRRESRSDVTWH